MIDLEVRRAKVGDARGVARVQVAAFQSAYRRLLPADYLGQLRVADRARVWTRRLRGIRPSPIHVAAGTDVWVATLEGEVVGFACAHPDRDGEGFLGYAAELSYLYVHPAFQGRGVGTALLDRSVHALSRRDFLWMTVSVLERNVRARAFYERNGLRFDGTRHIDPQLRVPIVRHARALNPIFDFGQYRTEVASANR